MELDDLKHNWEEVSNQLKNQKIFNSKSIDQMTQAKFKSKLKRITYPELIGVIICLAAAVFIGLNFEKLDTIFFKSVGIVSIILLLTISLLSFLSLQQLTRVGDMSKTYAETLNVFLSGKIKFHKLQRINFIVSHLLLVTVILLLPRFFNSTGITDINYFWVFSITLGYVFLLFYSKWVLKSYNNTLRQTEDLLKEIQL